MRKYYIEDVGDADGLEQLAAGGVVVTAEVEEIAKDLGGEGAVLLERRPLLAGRRQPVPAHAAHLAVLVLVVVPAYPARVLPLPLSHRRAVEIGSRSQRGVERKPRPEERGERREIFVWSEVRRKKRRERRKKGTLLILQFCGFVPFPVFLNFINIFP